MMGFLLLLFGFVAGVCLAIGGQWAAWLFDHVWR